MVAPRELLRRIQAEPFEPFRVRLTDGTEIDVPFPRMLVGPEKALIVIKWKRSARGSPLAVDWRTVPLAMIDQIEDRRPRRRTNHKRS